MTEQIPPWLQCMRTITGLTETPGSADNQRIMFMADYVGHAYPEQEAYASYYTGDDVAWCGLAMAFCMSVAGIEPVFGQTDTERWMWALAWSEWIDSDKLTEPQLGCVVVTEREGGGHVTLYESTEGGMYKCRGGNQSDMVNVTSIDPSSVVALVWPKYRMRPDVFTPELTTTEIAWTQSSLNLLEGNSLELDGEMGPMTKDAITQYQHHNVLPVTGVADKRTVGDMIVDLEEWNETRYRNDK